MERPYDLGHLLKQKNYKMDHLRKIIHIDMDCFFAAVEMRDNPELVGKPIAVGGTTERSVVATANYEARKYGVHSAMSVVKAKQLCPQLILIPARHKYYLQVSEQIRSILHEYTDKIEPLSCDEAFLDVTENKPHIELAVDIAKEIKQKIRERLHLTASAGVSYNKFLAKVASDYRKPDGLCTIHPDRALDFISKLDIEDFWGVGKVTAKKMRELGINNGEQLRVVSLEFLQYHFGKAGQIFYDFSRGIDNREVEPVWKRKSVGTERTFEQDIFTLSAVTIQLYHLTEELVRRLENDQFIGHTLTLKVKFNDFQQITRSTTRKKPFKTLKDILTSAKELIKEIDYKNHPIRLLGISINRTIKDETKKPVWKQLSFKFKSEENN